LETIVEELPSDGRPCWNMIRIITLVLWGHLEGPWFGHVY
jgi:hypothetical protein